MAWACSSCTFTGNADSSPACSVCGAVPVASTSSTASGTSPGTPPPAPPAPPASAPPTGHAPPASSAPATPATPRSDLSGRVTWLENSSEIADLDLFRLGSQIIILLTILPLLAALFTVSFALWAALSIAGFHGMARDFSPFGLVNTLNSFSTLAAVIFPRVPRCEQVPAIRLTVQTAAGERSALIKGVVVSGTLRRGDDVDLQGEWRNGMLVFRRGFNNTLGGALELRRGYWHVAFFVLLLLFIVIISSLLSWSRHVPHFVS